MNVGEKYTAGNILHHVGRIFQRIMGLKIGISKRNVVNIVTAMKGNT